MNTIRRSLTLAILLGGLPAGAQDEAQVPGPHHERLYAFLGEWKGEVIWPRSEVNPDGLTVPDDMRIGRILGGAFIEMRVETQYDGFRFLARAIYGYDVHRKCYTKFWFDRFGSTEVGTGSWTNEGLVFEHEAVHEGRSVKIRDIRRVIGRDAIEADIYVAEADSDDYRLLLTTRHRRIGAPK